MKQFIRGLRNDDPNKDLTLHYDKMESSLRGTTWFRVLPKEEQDHWIKQLFEGYFDDA